MRNAQVKWVLAMLFVSLVCGTAFGQTAESGEKNLQLYLKAIAQVESGDNPSKVGSFGERTRWQIRQTEWKQWSEMPFKLASDTEGRRVAGRLLTSRIQNFEKTNSRAPTADEVYLLWHRPARVGSPTAIEKRRASRFANLLAEAAAVKVAKNVPLETSPRNVASTGSIAPESKRP